MTESTIQIKYEKSSLGRRITAFVIDYFVFIYFLLTFFPLAFGSINWGEKNAFNLVLAAGMFLLTYIFLFLAKDSFHGMSLGKWIMGITIRDENLGIEVPSFNRLLLRNMFLFILPMEIIVLAISKDKKRLGDVVFKTIVVNNPKKASKFRRILFLLSFVIILIPLILFRSNPKDLLKKSRAYQVALKEIKVNEEIQQVTEGVQKSVKLSNGSINVKNDFGKAHFEFEIHGKTNQINVQLDLTKKPKSDWIILKRGIMIE